jgi:peptidylprolyl isomerase
VPPSKQARSRQARQKERLAIAAARRQQVKRRRRRLVAAAAALAVVIVVIVGVALGGTSSNEKSSPTSAPTTAAPPSTAAPRASAKGKPCVGLKDAVPNGAPRFVIPKGPPPAKLVTKDLKTGTGTAVKPGATITVNYVGVACSTGKIFDATWGKTDAPAQVSLSQVVPGWQTGIPGMRVGGQRLLGLPPALGYGSADSGNPLIAPDEALWFVVEVTKA